jgi:hypothetical protein
VAVQVDVFGFSIEQFQLSPGQQMTFWFGTPEPGGWSIGDYGHVSPMLSFDSPSDGPLEVVSEGAQRIFFTDPVDGGRFRVHVRLVTFRNPTNAPLVFHVRAIRAPAR